MTKLVEVQGSRYRWQGALVLPAEYFQQEVLRLKVWTGTGWVAKPVKVWDGQAWVTKRLKGWNATDWI